MRSEINIGRWVERRRAAAGWLALAWLVLAGCAGARAPAAPRAVQPVADLARLLVVYSYTAVQRPYLSSWFEGRADNPVRRNLARLDRVFAALGGDLATRMAFTRGAYVLPVGAAVEVPGERPESMLFVVPLTGGDALLVLSSDSPRRTSIAIASAALDVVLLYDSFERNRDQAGREETLGVLARIAVLAGDRLLLEDVPEPGAPRRTFELSVAPDGVRFAPPAP
jgi:hypothetical protein